MRKRGKLVVGNWKMNPPTLAEAKDAFKAIRKAAVKLKKTKTVVCPPYFYVAELAKLSKGEILVGVQNVAAERSGSYTGEVSAVQAASVGADYAIVGHSERRAMGETDETISKKLIQAITEGLTPILCIGEKERDKEGLYLEALKEQVKGSLQLVSKKDLGRVIIAYEPVWAIGKSDNEAPAGKDVHGAALYIRKILAGIYGKDNAFLVPILYGGSVTYRNGEDIAKNGEIDGLLVGRQSLEPDGFAELLNIIDSI